MFFVDTHFYLSVGLSLTGNYNLSYQHLETALAICNKHFPENNCPILNDDFEEFQPWKTISAHNILQSVNHFKKQLSMDEKLYGLDSRIVANTHYLLAQAYESNHKIDKAKYHYKQAIEIGKISTLSIKDDTVVVKHQNNIALAQSLLDALLNKTSQCKLNLFNICLLKAYDIQHYIMGEFGMSSYYMYFNQKIKVYNCSFIAR